MKSIILRGRFGGFLQKAGDDVVRRDAFRIGREIGEEAVAEDGQGDGPYVAAGHVYAALEDGAGLRAENKALRGAGPRAAVDVLSDEIRSFVRFRPRI